MQVTKSAGQQLFRIYRLSSLKTIEFCMGNRYWGPRTWRMLEVSTKPISVPVGRACERPWLLLTACHTSSVVMLSLMWLNAWHGFLSPRPCSPQLGIAGSEHSGHGGLDTRWWEWNCTDICWSVMISSCTLDQREREKMFFNKMKKSDDINCTLIVWSPH